MLCLDPWQHLKRHLWSPPPTHAAEWAPVEKNGERVEQEPEADHKEANESEGSPILPVEQPRTSVPSVNLQFHPIDGWMKSLQGTGAGF